MKKHIMILVAALAAMTAALGANVAELQPEKIKVTVNSPAQVQVGEEFKISYVFSYPDDLDDYNLKIKMSPESELKEWVVGVPDIVVSKIVNVSFKRTEMTFSYKLEAREAGVYEMPPYAIVTNSGDTIASGSPARKITVVEPADSLPAEPWVTDAEELMLRLTVDKPEIQLGDTLTLDVTLLTNVSLLRQLRIVKPLTIKGCRVEPVDVDAEGVYETVDGKTLVSYNILRYKVTPLKAGRFKVKPVKAEVEKGTPAKDPFRFGDVDFKICEVTSDKVEFRVLPAKK